MGCPSHSMCLSQAASRAVRGSSRSAACDPLELGPFSVPTSRSPSPSPPPSLSGADEAGPPPDGQGWEEGD
eukprot:10497426-Prorocentrum_lima.AAC.1